ncbi:MAG: FtsX-like permease family protein [Pseudomonadota bacterium]
MSSLLSQIWTVVVMNIRSLPQRLWMSLAAVFAVSVVVAVLLSFLAMANGFEETLKGTGRADVAIASRVGSQSELNSTVSRDNVNLLLTAPGIAKDSNGDPVASAELYVIVDGIKKTTQTEVNLPMRGISQSGFALRDAVEIVEGRMFESGRNEIIVGQGILNEFEGFELGQKPRFGRSQWEVVGIFSTGGTAFESELWADAPTVQSQFNRGSTFQTVRIKLAESGTVQPLVDFAESEPRLQLDIETEADYFASQGEALNGIVNLGWALSIVMALGALAGALNTMYTSVAARSKEIATLRTLGFSNFSAFVGTMAESLVLSVIGGIVGSIAAYLLLDGVTASTLGASFSQVVFSFELSTDLIKQGIVLALIVGLVGGFFPAFRAARLPVLLAFRDAT